MAGVLRSVRAFAGTGPIRIGVMVPLQGPSADLTRPFLAAARLAVAERHGKHRYELVVADSGPNGRDASHAAEQLIYRDRVAAIVGGISLSGQVVRPYAALENVAHLCVCSVRTIGDGDNNFTNIPLPEDEAATWVREARARGVKTVAVLSQNYPSIQGHINALAREIAGSDLRLVYSQEFTSGTTDFAAMVSDAAAAHPDVFMIEAFNPSLDALGRELHRRGIRSIASIVSLSMSAEPDWFEGAWYTDSYLLPAFRERFARSAPEVKLVTHMVPYAFESTNMLLDAFEADMDPSEYLRRLTRYSGVSGTLTRNEHSGNFRSQPAVWELRAGVPTLLHH